MLEMVETSDARQLKEIVESQLMRGAVVEAEKHAQRWRVAWHETNWGVSLGKEKRAWHAAVLLHVKDLGFMSRAGAKLAEFGSFVR